MLGRLATLLALAVLASPLALAAPAGCSPAEAVGDVVIPEGECLSLGPGAEVTGRLLVHGRLVAAGSVADPVDVRGSVVVLGSAVLEQVRFAPEREGLVVGSPDRRADVAVTRATFELAENATGVVLTDRAAIEISESRFSGAGTGIRGVLEASSLHLASNTFSGPGFAISATVGGDAGLRLAMVANDFTRAPETVDSFSAAYLYAPVSIRGTAVGPGAALVTSTANTYRDSTVGLALDGPGFRFVSSGDRFLRNGAGAVADQGASNAVLDRSTFSDNRYDLVLPSRGDVAVTNPLSFDDRRVFVTEASGVTVDSGGNRFEVTYARMVERRTEAAAIASVAAVAFAFTGVGRSLFLKFLFVPMYARLSPEQVLNHEKRQEILSYVHQNPGTHLRRIGYALQLSYGTLTYHLYRLERAGFVTYNQEGLFKRYYSSAGRLKEQAKSRPMPTALRELERSIYDTIREHPGSAQSHIAERLSLSRQALHYHIKKLEKAGYIRKVPQGRETLVYALDAPEGPASEVLPSNT